MDSLTRTDVTAWLKDLERSMKTKRNVHALLSAVPSSAVRDGVVTTNVAKGIRIGGGTGVRREAVFLTLEEVEAIAEQVLDPTQGLLARLPAPDCDGAKPPPRGPRHRPHPRRRRAPGERLFVNTVGGAVTNATWHRTWWKQASDALEQVGLLRARPRNHDLRHTLASWLIATGVPLTVIQRRLGHDSIKTTSDRYGHFTDDSNALAAAAMD